MEKKNVIMDATLLNSLMSCARYHDLRYNRKFTSIKGKSNSLEVGSLIHKIFEVYYKHLVNGFSKSQATGNALIAGQMYVDGCPYCADENVENPTCGHESGEYPGVENTAENSEGYKTGWRFAIKTCEEYFEFYKNDAWIPLAVETVKGDIVYEDDELRILWKAKLDLLTDTNQGILSVDHKTMKQRREKTSLNNQFIGQCVLLKTRNVIINKIGLQTSLKPQEKFTREVVSYAQDRLEEWRTEILPYYAYKYLQFAESEHWPPNFTHCDSVFGPCQFKEVCESNRGMREEVLQNNFKISKTWDPQPD